MDFIGRLRIFEKRQEEHRKFLRFSLSLRAECHYNAGKMAEQCRIVDICQQGLGFELDSRIGMRFGQNVLLKIGLSPEKIPVSAIVKLTWVKSPSEGFMTQRVGSRLLFMYPREKAQLLQHAYAEILHDVSREDSISPGLSRFV